MIAINNVLLSEDIIEKHFVCDISKCKGACCWEGDFGAPLEKKEIDIIQDILHKIKKYLPDSSKEIIQKRGYVTAYGEKQFLGTELHQNGACIFLTDDTNQGIGRCAFEVAFNNREIDFQKPLSCHLYPIRVTKNPEQGFEAWNYDRWDLCAAACKNGEKLKMSLFQFSKDAIVRAKGRAFYEQLVAYEEHKQSNS